MNSVDQDQPARSGLAQADAAPALEIRIARAGDDLLAGLTSAFDALPDPPQGPQSLSRRIGIDKVLASRIMKTLRCSDPMSVIHRSPGPEPLRRVVKALGKQGVDATLLDSARQAIDRFEMLIREEIGDRSSLDAIISAWVPEARREFELRRKQSACKALSQLKGCEARMIIATVLLAPSDDGEHIDIVWLNGLYGLQRLRPGAGIKFATRRMQPASDGRRPLTLDGEPLDRPERVMLQQFCSKPSPRMDITTIGEAVHYTLADEGFGPRSAVDLVFGEVNRAEIRRYLPKGSNRKGNVFAEVSTPSRALQFDAFVHRDIYPDSDPQLRIYDTAFEGVADANNPARDIDQLDLMESIEKLGMGVSYARSPDIPKYTELVRHACERMGWEDSAFRCYRCRVDYPLYGSQLTMLFDPPKR